MLAIHDLAAGFAIFSVSKASGYITGDEPALMAAGKCHDQSAG